MRDRLIGLAGVVFYGIFTIAFGVLTVLMAVIIAIGANNLARTILIAAMCAVLAVFHGWRLRQPLRRLRGIDRPNSF